MAVGGAALRLRAVRVAAARREPPVLRLHTISYSHYVEKVRWCMDRLGVPYEEVRNAGILGVLLTGRTVPWLEVPPGLTRISESSRILRCLWGEYCGRLPPERVAFLEPTPAALELEALLDRRLGNDVRVWAYSRIFRRRDLTLRTWGCHEPGVPGWQRALLYACTPLLRFAVRRMLGVTEARGVAALERTHQSFATIDALLADGRRHLCGDRLSYVDITFASLAALALLPPEYTGRSLHGPPIAPADLDDAWRAEVEALRARPAGRYALALYRDHRLAGPG
ncbi:MAG: glutathione S-transferase C-terminal domain-containing protein [Steroidobacteraceae bacterium]